MKPALSLLGRLFMTAIAVAAALVVALYLWRHYMDDPWTRDGRVRADIVAVAPDVSGFVTDVLVHDNQRVHRGDVIFRIDKARFTLAEQQAEAAVAGRKASLDQAERDLRRYRELSNTVVSQQKQEQVLSAALQARAAYSEAGTELAVARLNLARSDVRASVNGIVSNMSLQPGAYVTAGRGVMALVDSDSLHVEGYFEETKLGRIRVGDRVRIHLMGDDRRLSGHVDSIAAGIEDRDRTAGASLLADVNPTFSWVRLAQRVPVRIRLDDPRAEAALVVGRTATVEVVPPGGEPTLLSYMRDLFSPDSTPEAG